MIRLFAVIILLLGIAQTAVGVFGLWVLLRIDADDVIAHLLEEANIDVSALQTQGFAISAVLVIAGNASLVCAFGLFKLRQWARKLWLIVISVSLVFYVAWFASDLLSGHLEWENWFEISVVIAIFAVSWGYFSRRTVRRAFLVNRGR